MNPAEPRADQSFEGIRISAADWPVVLVEFPEKRVADASLHSALGHLESLMRDAASARERLFILTDIGAMREIAPASQRRYTAEWMKRVEPLSRISAVGGATVTPSSILRGILTAVFWIQPPIGTMVTAATRHEAMLKGIQALESKGVRLPPRLVAYRDGRSLSRAG